MAGVDKLKEKIMEEARLTAEGNIERARQEVSGILHSAREEAGRKQREIIEKAQRDAADRIKRIQAYAGLEARKKRLEAKQKMVDAAFEKAIGKLQSLPVNEYLDILTGMVTELAVSGNEEIILSEKDTKRMGDDLVKSVNERLKNKGMKASVKLSDEPGKFDGGFILKSGDVEINSTFDTMVRVRRDQLEAEVVKILFRA